ncbi:hypothetical protein [Crocosphaera watsonii]|uniref:hypothetical protein n=1 Tax=Crocosphaera watsonii TaxID=263511 RepID=UPI001E351877|nr:hypothetical protein [Crocosphaera watsonii]
MTNTTYYGDGFMENFGGDKDGPNAYNFEYIWPALKAVINRNVQPHQLEEDGFELKELEVVENEPIVSKSFWSFLNFG